MSEQVEKIKVPIEESKIPAVEVPDIINESTEPKKNLWKAKENSNFWNASVDSMDKVAPTFVQTINSILDDPQYKGKKAQPTFKGFMFGKNNMNGFDFFWRMKMGGFGGGGSGGSSNFKNPPMPLEEIFCGPWTQANMVLQDKDKKWYLAGQETVINPNVTDPNDPNFAVTFVTIKRNRWVKPPEEKDK